MADLRATRTLAAVAILAAGISTVVAGTDTRHRARRSCGAHRHPTQYLVLTCQEKVSFDHYFGSHPNAANTGGQPFSPPRAPRPSTASHRRC